MNVPIMRVNTVNPQSVIPGAKSVTSENQFQKGVQQQQAQQDRARKQEREDFDFEQGQLKAERAPYEAMMKNPEMADMIAQQYGITIDDNVRAALRKPAEFDRLIKGGQAAKAYGITDPRAASTFAATYMKTGDLNAAQQSIAGMALSKPEKPSYSHIKSVGGSLVDARTGEVIYSSPDSAKPVLEPLRPGQGLYDYTNSKWAVEPNAQDYNSTDPFKAYIAQQLGGGGVAPMSPVPPAAPAGAPQAPMTAPKPLDPETAKRYDSLIGK